MSRRNIYEEVAKLNRIKEEIDTITYMKQTQPEIAYVSESYYSSLSDELKQSDQVFYLFSDDLLLYIRSDTVIQKEDSSVLIERYDGDHTNAKHPSIVLDDFSWDVLKMYIKHGFGECKFYNTSFFSASLSDETAMMTLYEIYHHATNYAGNKWSTLSPLVKDN